MCLDKALDMGVRCLASGPAVNDLKYTFPFRRNGSVDLPSLFYSLPLHS